MKNFNSLEIVERVFDENFNFNTISSQIKLSSFYKRNFRFLYAEGSFKFIYIIPLFDDIPFEFIKGAYAKVTSESDLPAFVFVQDCSFKNIDQYMINKINYISSDGNHCWFKNNSLVNIYDSTEKVYGQSYTRNTQLIVQFYLKNEIKPYTTREIANYFDFSPSTVSRCNSFLLENGLIIKEGVSTGARYYIKSKSEFFKKVQPFLIKPYIRKYNVILSANEKRIFNVALFECGDRAFARYTDIGAIDIDEYALNKRDFERLRQSCKNWQVDPLKTSIYSFYEFIYDPFIFASEKVISAFDTYLIMKAKYKDTDDQRIIESLKQLENLIINGK